MPYDPVHPENSGVLYDESGKPYVMQADGKGGYTRNYISPVAFGAAPPVDNTGIFHQAPQWNTGSGQYETPFDWGNLLTLGVGGALGLGAADAFLPGLFGGGAAASQAAPAMQGGGTVAANLGSASALPSLGGAAAGAGGGSAAAASAGAAGLGPAMDGGSSFDAAGNALSHAASGGFNTTDLLKLLGVGGLTGLNLAQSNRSPYPPELDSILALQKQRMDAQTPLYNSILKLSQSRLPTSAGG